MHTRSRDRTISSQDNNNKQTHSISPHHISSPLLDCPRSHRGRLRMKHRLLQYLQPLTSQVSIWLSCRSSSPVSDHTLAYPTHIPSPQLCAPPLLPCPPAPPTHPPPQALQPPSHRRRRLNSSIARSNSSPSQEINTPGSGPTAGLHTPSFPLAASCAALRWVSAPRRKAWISHWQASPAPYSPVHDLGFAAPGPGLPWPVAVTGDCGEQGPAP